MKNILSQINKAYATGEKMLAILLDPDKLTVDMIKETIERIHKIQPNYIFVGGSVVKNHHTDLIVNEIKNNSSIPIVLFPGDINQITDKADALLFLNLISGDNPEYLIKQQIKSAAILKNSSLEIISTGYILIDGGTETSTQKVSQTLSIPQQNIDLITDTAYAGQLMGKQLIYLEAGSGAQNKVDKIIIKKTSNSINIPIIVGGGIKSKKEISLAHENGATLVVVGTAFENNNFNS